MEQSVRYHDVQLYEAMAYFSRFMKLRLSGICGLHVVRMSLQKLTLVLERSVAGFSKQEVCCFMLLMTSTDDQFRRLVILASSLFGWFCC